MRKLAALVAGAVVAALIPVAGVVASTRTDGVEVRTLELINQGRPSNRVSLVMHAGLRTKAQEHSLYQSQLRKLTHDGFSTRVNTATPDPFESNGAPDDGFGAACENVAYYYPGSGGATDEQVAKKFYDLWYNSSGHRNCMFDSWGYNLNVAGMGIYLDSRGYWWATFISVRDLTPPSGSSEPPPTSSPPPSSAPPPSTETWQRVEQTDASIAYSGSWSSYSSSSASGRSYVGSSTTGGYARYTFDGTGVRWVGLLNSYGGIAEVRLDGAVVARVDQYQRRASYKRVLFESTELQSGQHTIEVVVTGQRNSRARIGRTYVDAFDIYG